MKPPRFQYACPMTLPEALALLSQHNGDAAVLAGGQSLMPMLNLRVAQPAILIDINRVPELDAIIVRRQRPVHRCADTPQRRVALSRGQKECAAANAGARACRA